jgi:hypothetical protein
MKTERTKTPDPQLRQQLDAKIQKYNEAFDKKRCWRRGRVLHRGGGSRDGQGTDLRSGGY